MTLQHHQGAASAAPTFSPSAWLDSWTDAGGGFALTPSGALIFLCAHIDGADLEASMRVIVGKPDRLLAVREAVEARHG